MMFDEESKKRTSEYIFGAESKHKTAPARKSNVAKELTATAQMEKIASDTEYMMEELKAMRDKLDRMHAEYSEYDGDDFEKEDAMWEEVLRFYESIADKIDTYAGDIEFYLIGLRAVSAKMRADVGSRR